MKDWSIPVVRMCIPSLFDKADIQLSVVKYFPDHNKASSPTSIDILLSSTIKNGTFHPTGS